MELSRSDYEKLIEEWVFSERDRAIMKRRILDGITYENIAEEFDLSVRNVQYIVEKHRKVLLEQADNYFNSYKCMTFTIPDSCQDETHTEFVCVNVEYQI